MRSVFATFRKKKQNEFLQCKGFQNLIKKWEVLPLEIKPGSPNKNGLFAHKALDNVLGAYPNIKKAYLLSQGNVAKEGKSIVLLPCYMSMFLGA